MMWTRFAMRDLNEQRQLVLGEIYIRGKVKDVHLLSVSVPLSDCALKYISTIWHHPPGRRTRRISAI